MPSLADAVLVVEDDDESHPANFARNLTALLQLPGAAAIRGLVVGRFQRATSMTRQLLEPIALLDVDGFWESLVSQLDRMAGVGLLKPASRDLIQRTRSAEEALGVLAAARPARPEKRISAEER